MISLLEDFHFIRPMWLLMLPVVCVVWYLLRKALDPLRGWHHVMEDELLRVMTVGQAHRKRGSSLVLLIGWCLGVLALAGPTWRPEPSPFADDPVPVMLVLKAGESMELTDLSPSRMERARLKVSDFSTERKGLPLGLLAYAGTAHLVLPPTRDTSVVATMASEISPAIMPKPGDDLAKALNLSAATLGDKGGAIVVIADTVPSGSEEALKAFHSSSRLPVHFLAVAREDSPEMDSIKVAASILKARVTVMTPDISDITSLVKQTAKTPIAVSGAGDGTRWAEAGWWLVPIIMVLMLTTFRREQAEEPSTEAAS